VLLLLPTLAMPLGQDQAAFFRGGRTMLEGGLLYADFIDVKPPLLYLLVGAGGMLFGSTEVGIRLFDLLWQSATLGLLLLLLRSRGATNAWLWWSAVIYATLYTTLGHAPTLQSETLFALPLTGTLLLVDRRSSWSRDLTLGLLCGVAFLLKYPLAIIGPACVLLFALRGDGIGSALVSMLRIGLGAALFIAAIVWPLAADPRFAPALGDVLNYLKVYASSVGWGMDAVVFGLKKTATFFGDNISILVCTAAILGLLASSRSLIQHAALLALFLGATIVLEGKFSPYHFSRLYLPLSIMAGMGMAAVVPHVSQLWSAGNALTRTTLAGAALILLLLSPLPRWGNLATLAVRRISNPAAFDGYLSRPEIPDLKYHDIRELREYLAGSLAPSDNVMLVSMAATPLLPFLPTRNVGPFADAHFMHGANIPNTWKQRALRQMEMANVVVVDTTDVCPLITMHPYTSWQAVQRDVSMMAVLDNMFERTDTVATFYIFRRMQ
jgi:hypothetical protein